MDRALLLMRQVLLLVWIMLKFNKCFPAIVFTVRSKIHKHRILLLQELPHRWEWRGEPAPTADPEERAADEDQSRAAAQRAPEREIAEGPVARATRTKDKTRNRRNTVHVCDFDVVILECGL